MSENTVIQRCFSSSRAFHEINEEIINWDYSDLQGDIFHFKANTCRGRYGHIGLKISYQDNAEDIIIKWSSNAHIPKEYKEAIIEVLSFFVSYLEGLRGGRVSLQFEVFEGSYHPVDSSSIAFQLATVYVLKTCFGKPTYEIEEGRRKLIAALKEHPF